LNQLLVVLHPRSFLSHGQFGLFQVLEASTSLMVDNPTMTLDVIVDELT
jgi:hypothetical protein